MGNCIYGFIELNGELIKVSSIEDLKALAARLDSAFTELSVKDYDNLCCKMQGEYKKDDCDVFYSKDGKQLLFAPITSDEYIIKEGTIAIASYAFNCHSYQCCGILYTNSCVYERKLYKLFIPDTVIAIGSEAFGDNESISNILVSQKLEFIGPKAFCGCRNLVDFIFPPTIKYIETEAFDKCYNAFKELTIPASVRHIGSHAFRSCTTLEKVTFSSHVDHMGSGIFESCDNLSEIVVPKGCVKQFCEQLPFYNGIITEASEE